MFKISVISAWGIPFPKLKGYDFYEEKLAKRGADKEMFDMLNKQIEKAGYITRTGSVVDATFIEILDIYYKIFKRCIKTNNKES